MNQNLTESQGLNEQIDIFGVFDGIRKIEAGWLTDDLAVELRIYNNSIHWLPECSDKKVRYSFVFVATQFPFSI